MTRNQKVIIVTKNYYTLELRLRDDNKDDEEDKGHTSALVGHPGKPTSGNVLSDYRQTL